MSQIPPVRSVLLVVTGSIAAFKAPELIRMLRAAGIAVRCVLTKGGAEFVTPLTLQALSGERVHTDLFSLTAEQEMGHIALSRSADLVLVCPASADFLAKMAHGLADDIASTLLLATDTPVMVAPAMNVRMWEHAATQANVTLLRQRGVQLIAPVDGVMACGESGPGRMAEPADISDTVVGFFRQKLREGRAPLAGRRALVTAGPTHEPLDPVRYIANRSSGLQGYAIAEALADLGADVTLVSGPTQLRNPAGMAVIRCETARDMQAAVHALKQQDIAVCTAAVADWRPAAQATQKLKKQSRNDVPPPLALTANPDILAELSQSSPIRPQLVVGFAAETENVAQYAQAKLKRKQCDWIVANNVGANSDVMGGSENEVMLITSQTSDAWPRLSKTEVARKLAVAIADWFSRFL
ncbi:bifunctional phosphopantothenoylcysteine decarboxylase/phosphopantothenate--cysteine ligase CoaBC [Acetobacter thailandicus]|uniref:Coenzyme A biosynthesis bifunctional protein CoaBC n=1 Tax=Acetobacter thailandicus TaxID=1502842 RepID=A0ABT3QG50_9PROT|nr:bifunctional phosphopantothenoylcysteine decarboxylase/phosphopantothenate--cysteine ligase CoaBC [Acetobacter thailandicus]MCX2564231.1 bifunctional phosphopantothenoylcysteine decarboxylase/phosphopantothenate--cysteine ligase CoaBC [Acetobacter thailandicus]NHN95575.1 bifunctional phosphopantothenoylcysteine decarboxylase/phosphopantothenate--cysteine ligase CoaBC [Acetobacter thailandicus]